MITLIEALQAILNANHIEGHITEDKEEGVIVVLYNPWGNGRRSIFATRTNQFNHVIVGKLAAHIETNLNEG